MPMDSLQFMLRILDNENRLLERADQKSMSMLSILGVFMVFFIVYYRIIPINILTIILISVYFLFALLSIFNLIMAIKPRIRIDRADAGDTLPDSPTFFAGICRYGDPASYCEALQGMIKDEPSVIGLYSREIYDVARINSEKYRYVRRGIFLVITTLAIELGLIVYLFIFYMGEGRMPPVL